MCASPGTKPPRWWRPRSSGSRRPTADRPSAASPPHTTTGASWATRWARSPAFSTWSKARRCSTTRIAGKAGTGVPPTATASNGGWACPSPTTCWSDALQNAEMIVYWSNDPDSTRGTYSGQDSALWRQWLKEKGVKMVFIDPFHNYTNAVMGGKWIAPRPGTDTAMAMAIATSGSPKTHTTRTTCATAPSASMSSSRTSWARPTGCPRPPSGRPRNPASTPGSSVPWRGSGPRSAPSSPAVPGAGKAAPAARRSARNGPA